MRKPYWVHWSIVVAACALMWSLPAPAAAQDANPRYTNLHVLPADVGDRELGDAMLENLSGLGLPRRAGEGCLYCHVGSTETHRSEWDYASDAKPEKEKARVMMAMVREINEGYLGRLADRTAPVLRVTCYTCHAGRTDPRPLPELLIAEYRSGGLEALTRTYREARARYFAADAYDFRVGTLLQVAGVLANLDETADAAGVHELNIEYYDEPTARAGLIRLRLVEALEDSGIDAMLTRYESLRGEHPESAFGPSTLDALGWGLYRSDRQDAARALFELNLARHPGAFTSHESMAYVAFDSGDEERGLAIARAWIEAHPDHVAGRQLLEELLRSRL